MTAYRTFKLNTPTGVRVEPNSKKMFFPMEHYAYLHCFGLFLMRMAPCCWKNLNFLFMME